MTKYGIANTSVAVERDRQDTLPDRIDVLAPASSARPVGDADRPTAAGEIACSFAPLADADALGQVWTALEARCTPSLFQSWGWVRTWLNILPREIEPYVFTARRGAEMCGLGVFCRAQRRRHRWLASNGLFLGETGVPELDTLTIEYNGLLCADGDRAALTAGAMAFLLEQSSDWDEVYLSGVDDEAIAVAGSVGLGVTVTARHPCHFVDLAEIREGKKSYLERVSRNTRSQVRRAVRRYEERGEVSIAAAATVDQALAWFDDMKTLHQVYWQSRGEPGAFANPVFEAFHRALIASRFSAGEIEMLRVTAGDSPIGYLYNIAYRGHVYSYQSGFAYEQDNAMKPGLVSHYLAIERNLAESVAIYDFMAGGGQHKKSLGTCCRDMVWLRAARPRLKFRAEALLRAVKQRLATPED